MNEIDSTAAGTRITPGKTTAKGQVRVEGEYGRKGRSRKRNRRREGVAQHSKHNFTCFRFYSYNNKTGSKPIKPGIMVEVRQNPGGVLQGGNHSAESHKRLRQMK
jgi:hypothetical protein